MSLSRKTRSTLRKSTVTTPALDFQQHSKEQLPTECPVCLDRYKDARQLPCGHSFCVDCLQYTIDISDQNGGFNCILCHEFIHLDDQKQPKSQWATQFSTDPRSEEQKANQETDLSNESTCKQEEWKLDWQLTIHPKSENRSPAASKSHMKSFDLKKTPTIKTLMSLPKPQEIQSSTIKLLSENKPESHITAALYADDLILVYDEGLRELLLYSEDGTLRYSSAQQPIYDLAVLDSAVYMTNPNSRCIEILQLYNMRYRRAIELTMRCYGIDVIDDSLVVLLSEGHEPDHVTFVGKDGVTGGQINVDVGRIDLRRPRQIAVCRQNKLIFVSDEENCVLKCFDVEGDLQWEKTIWNPERLDAIDGHLVIARRWTNTLDVLTHRGKLAGHLDSDEYEISTTGIIAINRFKSAMIVVDANSNLHMFHLRHQFPPNSSCSCCII